MEGKVICQAVIGTDGTVKDVTILRSSNSLFDQAAIQAVRKWKYKPASQNGRPVSVYFTVVVDFELN
jgi:protein TonB